MVGNKYLIWIRPNLILVFYMSEMIKCRIKVLVCSMMHHHGKIQTFLHFSFFNVFLAISQVGSMMNHSKTYSINKTWCTTSVYKFLTLSNMMPFIVLTAIVEYSDIILTEIHYTISTWATLEALLAKSLVNICQMAKSPEPKTNYIMSYCLFNLHLMLCSNMDHNILI